MSSFDLTCSIRNVRQVESLTSAMWLISMGTNCKAWFDSFLILKADIWPKGVCTWCKNILFQCTKTEGGQQLSFDSHWFYSECVKIHFLLFLLILDWRVIALSLKALHVFNIFPTSFFSFYMYSKLVTARNNHIFSVCTVALCLYADMSVHVMFL